MHCWETRRVCLKTIVLPEHESKERVHCAALEMKLFHEKRWALIIVKVAETQSEKTLRSYYKQDFHFEFSHLPFLIQHCCCSIYFLLLHITLSIQEISQPLLYDWVWNHRYSNPAKWGWLWLSLTHDSFQVTTAFLEWRINRTSHAYLKKKKNTRSRSAQRSSQAMHSPQLRHKSTVLCTLLQGLSHTRCEAHFIPAWLPLGTPKQTARSCYKISVRWTTVLLLPRWRKSPVVSTKALWAQIHTLSCGFYHTHC